MNIQVPDISESGTATGYAWQWSGPYALGSVREASISARGFLADHGLVESDLSAWELILTEAGNNCVIHHRSDSSGLTWQVQLLFTSDRVIARIHDCNQAFAWPSDPHLPDDDSESGRGIFLIHTLTDFRKYDCHPGGNILTLERRHTPAVPREDLEPILDAMTEELAACYESLSAIFKFTAEARHVTRLEDFAAKLLQHLGTITSSDSGLLRVVSNGQLNTLSALGCDAPQPCSINSSTLPGEVVAISSRQDQLIDETTSDVAPMSGLVHPFYHEDELMGLISLGRNHTALQFNAAEVSIVHTFAEFLAQQILSRRNQEEFIRSIVARREFELAAAIQKSLFPSDLPDIAGVSVTGHCESALSIGGDFYDIIPCEQKGYFFVIADVMGKGVAASMIAAVCRSIVRSSSHTYHFPGILLNRVAQQMHDDLERIEMFVTIAVGVVDVTEGVIRLANAGHCPVVICQAGGCFTEICPEQPPLGLEQNPVFREYEIPLEQGMRILAYTDGLIDPRNQRSSFDNQSDIADWFAEAASSSPHVKSLKSSLLARLGQNADPNTLADDQTFLIVGID
jgi:serine phosphatase RsbU (regulator of sigma subunit)/anti-sigma regulatory factor (Ser/Thr protein kinase)